MDQAKSSCARCTNSRDPCEGNNKRDFQLLFVDPEALGLSCWLEHDGISASQSRRDLPSKYHEGIVPGDGLDAAVQRLAQYIRQFGRRCLDGVAVVLEHLV